MPRDAALKSVLPELRKPGVAGVGVQTQLQIVVIKRQDLWRLQFDSDASVCFRFITFNDFISVGPTVTEKRQKNIYYTKTGSLFCKSSQPKASQRPQKQVIKGQSKGTSKIKAERERRKHSDKEL